MRRFVTVFFAAFLVAAGLAAQQSDVSALKETKASLSPGIGMNPARTPFSLLDLSRVRWSNSYSVSFFSGGGQSGSVGLWRTGMDYEISSKLHLSLNLGVLHNPGALWNRNETAEASLLPGFRLDYRPSDKVLMSLSVQRVAGYYAPHYGHGYYGGVSPLLME